MNQTHEDLQQNTNFKVNLTYPQNDEYEYFTMFERIDLDKERDKDLSSGNGFIISEPPSLLNKTLKSDQSIFSSKFGKTLQDPDPYAHRYSCRCGHIQGAFNAVPDDSNFRCPLCGGKVEAVGDDLLYFGYIVVNEPYCLIHPLMYEALASLIGKDNLESIIEPDIELDQNGNPMSNYDKRLLKRKTARKYKRKTSLDTTYAGIGIMGLRTKFQEICDHFLKKKSAKKDLYDSIMKDKDIVFTHSIPVYTTQLRIAKVENKRFTFEKTNADFNLLAKLAGLVNKEGRIVHSNYKAKNKLLWDMQTKIASLTAEIEATLAGKKGVIRSTCSGRTAYSSRCVIVPGTALKPDEVTLPYVSLVILLEQVITNILQKSYNITYARAYKMWYFATLKEDPRVREIIENLIKRGLVNVMINRNPTISYYSMVYQRVVKCTDGFTMGVNVFCLKGLGADFDGDTLNVQLITNKEFNDACNEVYNPRNAFMISRNDGLMNSNVNIFKDTVINLNAFLDLGRDSYSNAQLDKFTKLREKYPQMI